MAAIERKPYMDRIDRLKQRVLKTKPEMDLENAIILTKGFQESEGQPLCIRKAYAFKKQCLEKTVKIWGDELIGRQCRKQAARRYFKCRYLLVGSG